MKIKEYRVSKNEKGRTRPYIDFVCGGCTSCNTIAANNYKEDKHCSKCLRKYIAEKTFFKKAKEKFGNKYDLRKVKYISPTTKVEVVCAKHNLNHWVTPNRFLVKSYSHIKGHSSNGGCPKCAEEIQKTKNQKGIDYYLQALEKRFPQFSVIEHGTGKSVRESIKLYCEFHGKFKTVLHSIVSKESVHLCPRCSIDLNAWKIRTTRTDVKGKVYFLYLPDIQMFKFGVTCRDTKKRMHEIGDNVELIWELEFNTLSDAYFFEYQFFRHHKNIRYRGDRILDKGGYTELMTALIDKPTKRFIEEILCLKKLNSGEVLPTRVEDNPEPSLET